jgi:hypothetical protein
MDAVLGTLLAVSAAVYIYRGMAAFEPEWS